MIMMHMKNFHKLQIIIYILDIPILIIKYIILLSSGLKKKSPAAFRFNLFSQL